MIRLMPPLLAFATAWAVSGLLASEAFPFRIMDAPGGRSLHQRPVPRGGGVGVLLGILVSLLVRAWQGHEWHLGTAGLGVVMIAGVSLADDLRDVHPGMRILVHVGAAVLLLADSRTMPLTWWVGVPVILAVVWMVNLYNFMDGMDGFAGGMGAWGFGFLALCGYFSGREEYALSCLSIASANLGFLILNFPPARIFMGDVGSATMGFLVAGYALRGITEGWLPAAVPLLIFSPFIVDATVTLASRVFRHERFWEAHRTHYYQRLVRAGWGHRGTVLFQYGFMAAAGLAALYVMTQQSRRASLWVLLMWAIVQVFYMKYVRWLELRQRSDSR